MDKKETMKKHMITCSVIVLLVIFSAININPARAISRVKRPVKSRSHIVAVKSKFIFKNTDDENDYSFANEALPLNNKDVNHKLRLSLKKHNFRNIQSNILQNKAARIFPIIEPILSAYGIPDDFKYIPLVEGGLSEGSSPKGAKGLWQFMPGTARTYGLKVGHEIDERRNIRKSTIAACKYIRELYAEFNSWTLAAAAYNNGEIKLAHAIHSQNQHNYFRMHLNRETGSYVYNLIAMKAIITHPGRYGYKNNLKPNYFNPGSFELLATN